MDATKRKRGALVTGLVLLVIGIVSFVFQAMAGVPASTGYPFGIYLALFFALAGGGCGFACLGLAARFDWLPELAGKERQLYAGALTLLVCAGVTIALLDCGHPGRVLTMLYSSSPTSLVTWDFFLLIAFTALCVACLLVKDEKAARVLAIVAAAIAVLVVSVEALILIVTSGVEFWNNSGLVAVFILDGIAISLSLVMLFGVDPSRRMCVVLGVVIAVLAFLSLTDIVQGLYSGDASALIVAGGQFAPLYWIAMVACMVVPAVLMFRKTATSIAVKVGCGLALFGIFALKLVTVLAGEAPLAAGSIQLDAIVAFANTQHAFLDVMQAAYASEPFEFGCLLGVLGLAVLVYIGIVTASAPKEPADSANVDTATTQA